MAQANKPWYKKWWAIALFIIIGLVIIGSLLPDSNNNPPTNTNQPSSNQVVQNENILSSQSLMRIEQIVKNVGDYEVTVWDANGNFATESSTPYEIIVNTQVNQFSSCFDAKNSLYEIMKELYTDEVLNGKIARVQFTAWGYLKSSLGSDDADELKWNDFGPSNFWTVTLQYKDYEDSSSPLIQQTWGVKIDESCD